MFDTITGIFMQYGQFGLFVLAFLDSFILPVPPFFLQIAMSLLSPADALYYATVAFLGSVLGAPMGYLLGKVLGKPLMHKVVPVRWVEVATEKFTKEGDAAVLIGSFTPIPYKVFTILSGVFGFSLLRLIIYSIFGRGIKFYLIGILFYLYGRHAKELLDQYLEVSMLAVAVVLTIGWLLLRRRRNKQRT
jgi:membrane protein YqaA with SNARE-associated domain